VQTDPQEDLIAREIEAVAQLLSGVREPGESSAACIARLIRTTDHQRSENARLSAENALMLAAVLRVECAIGEWRDKLHARTSL
jgi:hypothetical protein